MTYRRRGRRVPSAFVALVCIGTLVPACSETRDSEATPTVPESPATTASASLTATTEPKSSGGLPKVVDVALADPGPTPPPLPQPEPLPEDPNGPAPEAPVGTIEIPRIGLSEPLHVGMTLTAINRGPSWWPGTAEPGGLGNMVIAGHRSTRSRPFADLDLLQIGDQIVVTNDAGRWTYAVTGTDTVLPSAVHIGMQAYGHTATLFACHPKGSAAQRIIVRLQLLGTDGVPIDDTETWNLAPPPLELDVDVDDTGGLPGEPSDPLIFADE